MTSALTLRMRQGQPSARKSYLLKRRLSRPSAEKNSSRLSRKCFIKFDVSKGLSDNIILLIKLYTYVCTALVLIMSAFDNLAFLKKKKKKKSKLLKIPVKYALSAVSQQITPILERSNTQCFSKIIGNIERINHD